MTLPSNVISADSFENRIGNYKTKLAKRLTLQGDWVVGLKELSYTKSWYTFSTDQTGTLFTGRTFPETRAPVVKTGVYQSVQPVIEALNSSLTKISQDGRNVQLNTPCRVDYDHLTRKVSVHLGQIGVLPVVPVFPPEVANILGFQEHARISKSFTTFLIQKVTEHPTYKGWKLAQVYAPEMAKYLENFKASFQNGSPVDMTAGIHSLFVYCDVVDPSFVGDSLTKLLRYVEIPSKTAFGEQVVILYDNPHYVPVLKKDFDSIEIDIKDDAGETIPFQFGRSIVTLEFKRVK